jgi:hypothetical protein
VCHHHYHNHHTTTNNNNNNNNTITTTTPTTLKPITADLAGAKARFLELRDGVKAGQHPISPCDSALVNLTLVPKSFSLFARATLPTVEVCLLNRLFDRVHSVPPVVAEHALAASLCIALHRFALLCIQCKQAARDQVATCPFHVLTTQSRA